jgi:hypothetical protein
LTYYLSGPMMGLDGLNFTAFEDPARELRGRGLAVISPTEIAPARASRGRQLGREVRAIIDDAASVAVLPGWQRSAGECIETFCAAAHGKPVVYYPSLRRVPLRALKRAWPGHDGVA